MIILVVSALVVPAHPSVKLLVSLPTRA